MLIEINNEYAWCGYWSAKTGAEILWKRKETVEWGKKIYNLWILLNKVSDSNTRYATTWTKKLEKENGQMD